MKNRIHIRRYIGSALPILAVCFFSACEHEIPVNAPRQDIQATFSSIQSNILSRKCAVPGCHTGSSPGGGLNMSAGQAYGNLIDVASQYGLPRIAPGEPNNSVLYQKVLGNSRFGNRMPLGGGPLSRDELNAILEWIDAGAPNN